MNIEMKAPAPPPHLVLDRGPGRRRAAGRTNGRVDDPRLPATQTRVAAQRAALGMEAGAAVAREHTRML